MKKILLFLLLLNCFNLDLKAQLSNLKFDVDLELDHMVVKNVKDLDGTEDLFGSLYLRKGFTINSKEIWDSIFWKKEDHLANNNPFRTGTYQLDVKKNIFRGLTLNELKQLSLLMMGRLLDHELGGFGNLPFRCVECSLSSEFRSRLISFVELSSTQNSINALVDNGLPQALKFGSDSFFEMNYYENSIKENGWVKFMWKVWVTPHK